jgi:hypothetical protein
MSSNVTLIDELPELEDIDIATQTSAILPISEATRVQKYIRNTNNKMPVESGMHHVKNTNNDPNLYPNYYNFMNNYKNLTNYQQNMDNFYRNMPHPTMKQYYNNKYYPVELYDSKTATNTGLTDTPSNTCLDFVNHIGLCPICSVLYKNDKTALYVWIGLLVLIIIILFNKVLHP